MMVPCCSFAEAGCPCFSSRSSAYRYRDSLYFPSRYSVVRVDSVYFVVWKEV